MALEWIRFSLCALLIVSGLFIVFVSVLGVFRFKFALNRMHTASMADTLGMLFVVLGMMVAYGWDMAAAKLLLLIVFMWFASPVSSHLVSELEILTDAELEKHLTVSDLPDAPPSEDGEAHKDGTV